MPASVASELFAPDVLGGVNVLLASLSQQREHVANEPVLARDTVAAAVQLACTELGARVSLCPLLALGSGAVLDEETLEHAVDRELAHARRIHLLAVDCCAVFAHTSDHGARSALRNCLEATWNVTRAVANRAFLAGEHGGRIVYLAPASSAGAAGEHADAARAGLENLARTLSIEWARHRVTVVAIAPGLLTRADELAALTAYLASPAGDYFSGCQLDLRGTGVASGGGG